MAKKNKKRQILGNFSWLREIDKNVNYKICWYSKTYVERPLKNRQSKILMKNGSLTHISPASFLWDIGKQCRNRSDAALKLTTQQTLKFQMDSSH